MNLVPLFGVIFMDWSVFALIYVFWLETLALSFFNALKIMFASGDDSGSFHFFQAFRYMFLRVLILGFYMIFILTFIGLMIAGKQGNGTEWIHYLLFLEPSFRITVLSFFIIKLVEFIYLFFIKDERSKFSPAHFKGVFDARLIVIHVALVGGFFIFDYLSAKFGVRYGLIGFASTFILLKIIVDYFSSSFSSVNSSFKND
jgi:hypothetical protein